jgi:hypothetical protein
MRIGEIKPLYVITLEFKGLNNMIIVNVNAYTFLELSEKAKQKVLLWLDEFPLEYEDEDGNIQTQYFYELEPNDIEDHCSLNGYLFDIHGNAIHDIL